MSNTLTANQASKLVPDKDGYYNVVLSHFGRRNQNGITFRPLTDSQIRDFNKVLRLGEADQRFNREDLLSISYTRAAFQLRDLVGLTDAAVDEEGRRTQRLVARIKPNGPQREKLEKLLKDPEGMLYFGVRAITRAIDGDENHREIVKLVTWDLISTNAYPEPA